MNKNKIMTMVSNHYKFFKFASKLYNKLSFKNKLSAKGVKLSMGVCVIKGLKIKNLGSNNEVYIGDFSRIKNSRIILQGNNNKIFIGEQCYLNNVEFYTEDNENEIRIGTHTMICDSTHLAAIEGTKISIGDDCLLSGELHFRTGDSHSILDLQGNRINPSEDIIINNHVWIGTKVTCLKGVHVAENSIVAATTTLTKKYDQPNSIIGGVPGKIIKSGVNWTHERISQK